MTGGTGAAADADHGWLAKALAGDPLACGVLDLARTLPAGEWDAFVRCVGRIKAGVSATDMLPVLQTGDGEWAS